MRDARLMVMLMALIPAVAMANPAFSPGKWRVHIDSAMMGAYSYKFSKDVVSCLKQEPQTPSPAAPAKPHCQTSKSVNGDTVHILVRCAKPMSTTTTGTMVYPSSNRFTGTFHTEMTMPNGKHVTSDIKESGVRLGPC